MPIYGSGDPKSDAVDESLKNCKYHLDVILCSLRCPTCDKQSKVTSQMQLLLLELSKEPDAMNVARDLRQYLLSVRG